MFSSLTHWISGTGALKPPKDHIIDDDDACRSCTDPCEDHASYPSSLRIREDGSILGSAKTYARHVLIGTGASDWPSKIEHESGTVAAEIHGNLSRQLPWKTLLTNTSLHSTHSTLPDGCDVLLLPDNILVSNVTPSNAADFCEYFLSVDPQQAQETYTSKSWPDDFKVQKSPFASLILICSHRRRDKRCGVTAPFLSREFDTVLRNKDIDDGEGGTAVLMVSHIGGHKFAGNVICYIRQGTWGIWYGRVKPCHCEAIVEQTILNEKVLMPLYRGAMQHSFTMSKDNKQW